ncbi:DUF3895 domain-containing protein [Bacillus thuringiensis]|uniref:DUF3895 domain-containing protein n=1 Tax=Bacillus thuringiensis TaxID=1428 RepID=UPI00333B92E0
MNIYLTQTERDTMLQSLSLEQQNYLQEFLKRGKKTAFASVLAQQKGEGLEDSNSHISTEWELIDFIDSGMVSNDLKCECGRSLRYQYIVKNLKTNHILRFGKSHFQEHTNIPSHIVNEVVKGMTKIDYELDEILIKIKNNWSLLESEVIDLPFYIELPPDIEAQISLNLPLLDKQISRLRFILSENMKGNFQESNQGLELFLFPEEQLYEALTNSEKEYINEYIKCYDTISIRHLCEHLISEIGSYNKRYTTGKPMIYPYISDYLDYLSELDEIYCIENTNLEDRIYKSKVYLQKEGKV